MNTKKIEKQLEQLDREETMLLQQKKESSKAYEDELKTIRRQQSGLKKQLLKLQIEKELERFEVVGKVNLVDYLSTDFVRILINNGYAVRVKEVDSMYKQITIMKEKEND